MCWFQVPSRCPWSNVGVVSLKKKTCGVLFFSYLIERYSSCYFSLKTCGKKVSGMDTHVVHGFPEQLQLVLGHGANLHKEHSETSEKMLL
jgi:hypothetical protein